MKYKSLVLILAFFTAVPVFAQEQTFQLSVEKEDMPYIQHYHEHYLGWEMHKVVTEHDLEDVDVVRFDEINGKIEVEEWKYKKYAK